MRSPTRCLILLPANVGRIPATVDNQPPTLVFWGADGHGSLYLSSIPKDPRWVRGNQVGLILPRLWRRLVSIVVPGVVPGRET